MVSFSTPTLSLCVGNMDKLSVMGAISWKVATAITTISKLLSEIFVGIYYAYF